MGAVSHIFSNAVANWTGTITGFNSQGSTTTIAATALVRPQDWNSVHNVFATISGNTSGQSTMSGTNILLQGGNNITLSAATAAGAATIVVSGPAVSAYQHYAPFDEAIHVAGQVGQGNLVFMPFALPLIQHDRILWRINYSNATNSSNSVTLSVWCGIYTRNASTLSLLSSTSSTWGVTNSGTQGVYSSVGGPRLLSIPWTNTITQGDYWVGFLSRTTTGGGAGMSISNFMASQINSDFSGLFSVASNNTAQRRLGQGLYSATTSALPNSVGFSQITGVSSALHWPPVFHFLSQSA